MIAQIDPGTWAELGGIGVLAVAQLYILLKVFAHISEQRAAFLSHIEKQNEREDRRNTTVNQAIAANTKATQDLEEAVKDLSREMKTINGRMPRA